MVNARFITEEDLKTLEEKVYLHIEDITRRGKDSVIDIKFSIASAWNPVTETVDTTHSVMVVTEELSVLNAPPVANLNHTVVDDGTSPAPDFVAQAKKKTLADSDK